MNFLKNLFYPKTIQTGIVFIVEDNAAYAKMLDFYIRAHFPSIKQVKIFPVGETCLPELGQNPDLIIIDYFLNSRYPDAETGLQIIQQIRQQKPELNIIVLSGQSDVQVVIDAVKKYQCSYVKKDDEAFGRIGDIMEELNH
ncbi:MAG: response regulator receiver protein [Bacteroidetes bacterium]|jgi:response regulator of citrate/malate metabolism|nr:response regulator receiver protein [Bacteroidota bacterium]